MVKTYVKRMVLDSCVLRTFYNVCLSHVLRMVNVRCTFCCVVSYSGMCVNITPFCLGKITLFDFCLGKNNSA